MRQSETVEFHFFAMGAESSRNSDEEVLVRLLPKRVYDSMRYSQIVSVLPKGVYNTCVICEDAFYVFPLRTKTRKEDLVPIASYHDVTNVKLDDNLLDKNKIASSDVYGIHVSYRAVKDTKAKKGKSASDPTPDIIEYEEKSIEMLSVGKDNKTYFHLYQAWKNYHARTTIGIQISYALHNPRGETTTLYDEISKEIMSFDSDIKVKLHTMEELSDAAFLDRTVRQCFFKDAVFCQYLVEELEKSKTALPGLNREDELLYIAAILQLLYSFIFNCEMLHELDSILPPRAFTMERFISALSIDFSEEGRKAHFMAIAKVNYETELKASTKKERDKDRDDGETPRRRRKKATEEEASGFDETKVLWENQHYMEDSTHTEIIKAMNNCIDLQVSVLCALDTCVQTCINRKIGTISDFLANSAASSDSFRLRLSTFMAVVVSRRKRRNMSAAVKSFFVHNYFYLLNRMTTVNRLYCTDMMEHRLEDFRYKLFDDSWMESNLLLDMSLLFNKMSFDLMQDVEERMVAINGKIKSESGFSKKYLS